MSYFTSGSWDVTFLTAARSRVGSTPMAMGSPSHSRTTTWASCARPSAAAIARRCAASRAASATATDPEGTRSRALSPAAWTTWATCAP